MNVLSLASITTADLTHIAAITEKSIADYAWTSVEQVVLSSAEEQQIADITRRLLRDPATVMNEATIWSRAIYPLLMLAEQGDIRAWVQVPLRASFPHVVLQGVADGVIALGITGVLATTYYIVVVEAKRGIEAQDPRLQLYGQLLAAARLNWEHNQQPVQEVYGCYTIGDSWSFLRAEAHTLDSDRPALLIEPSREYTQKSEAATILRILKRIVAAHVATAADVVALS
jgi:hypothetical protein